jgi:hypothetical protein
VAAFSTRTRRGHPCTLRSERPLRSPGQIDQAPPRERATSSGSEDLEVVGG